MLVIMSVVIRNKKTANSKIIDLTKKELITPAQIDSELPSDKPKTLKEAIANKLKTENQMNKDVPLPPGSNMLTRERFYTQEEINSMTIDDFKNMLVDTERRLPKKADLKELPPEALHNTPAIIIEAGRNLGAIKEVIKVHENYALEAIPFYSKCSKNDETPTTVRALCLTNLILLKKKSNQKINVNEYPKELIKLTKMVTDI